MERIVIGKKNVLTEAGAILLKHSYNIFHELRQYVDKLCKEHGVERRPVVQLNTLESIVGMVSAGTGVAVLPSGYLQSLNNPRIAILPFEDAGLVLQVGICYRRNKFLCAASRAFLEQVR